MARLNKFLKLWLETHWVAPAYAGGLLIGLAIAFFGAAVNSMAGWLYAISGIMMAIACVNIWLSPRSLRGLQTHRHPIRPVSVGEALSIEVLLDNTAARPKVLLEVHDNLPMQLCDSPKTAIAVIPPRKQHHWAYTCTPTRRGVYHWETVSLRTAAPFGLFWCQRAYSAPAHAIVYPQILPLTRCPLIDQIGVSSGIRWQTSRQSQQANEGLTRAVRPYRWGDPTRLIHWRTSARYGELRVRELEELTADNQVLIGLDTSDRWSAAAFESAVTTAASLYVYSLQHQLNATLWLPHLGILQNKHTLLTALAEVMPGQANQQSRFPSQPMIWLSSSRHSPQSLPQGSLWVRWLEENATAAPSTTSTRPALSVSSEQPLTDQLQAEIAIAPLMQ
ncbi:DUF58 domain-containing protein [Oscillatoria sp. CS-180]|uniref:DUF58 domain-containing protein n=1 Tax=Oscillatoria sp. CS-180 TaxID=3021720 RepID=UPI0023315B19|nr:DUF58 domain-containing protein [Oscillatoria sp. CS-180]MDB9527608.1 DUF58 domain-containing protein [Oscillatoria sp. CS-180]